MKKWIFAGVSVLLALALTMVACDFVPKSLDDRSGEEEFAQYSEDGRYVTINLDGGSPSKSMSRALTNALARINHDYYEVVFYYNSKEITPVVKISRTSWERGEGAALAVFRGNDGSVGIDYGSVDFDSSEISGDVGTDEDKGAAILFVGKKTSKGAVLLAVGTLKDTAGNTGGYLGSTIVKSTTSRVTFEIASLDSGIGTLVASSSFYTQWVDDTSLANVQGKFDPAGIPNAFTDSIDANSTNSPGFGAQFSSQNYKNVDFPLFMLKSDESSVAINSRFYAGKFTFRTAIASGTVTTAPAAGDIDHRISAYVKGIIAAAPASYEYTDMIAPNVIVNGEKINGNTEVVGVNVTMVNNKTADALFNNEAYFIIEVPKAKGGLIAFNFNIPVYAITSSKSDDNVDPVSWFIQPGVENNYIDNGIGLGGSILLGIGDPSKIKIESAFNNN